MDGHIVCGGGDLVSMQMEAGGRQHTLMYKSLKSIHAHFRDKELRTGWPERDYIGTFSLSAYSVHPVCTCTHIGLRSRCLRMRHAAIRPQQCNKSGRYDVVVEGSEVKAGAAILGGR